MSEEKAKIKRPSREDPLRERERELGLKDYALEPTNYVEEGQRCVICDRPLTLVWTIFHGLAVCLTCCASYKVYHYEGDRRISTKPVCCVPERLHETLKHAWREVGGDLQKFVPLARKIVSESGQQ